MGEGVETGLAVILPRRRNQLFDRVDSLAVLASFEVSADLALKGLCNGCHVSSSFLGYTGILSPGVFGSVTREFS